MDMCVSEPIQLAVLASHDLGSANCDANSLYVHLFLREVSEDLYETIVQEVADFED